MKQFLSLCLALLASLTGFSQIKKGDKIVGVSFGSISYTNSDSKTTYSNTPTVYNSDGNSFSVSVNPNVAWFIMDNLAVGGGLSLSYYTAKSESSNTSSTTTSDNKSTQPSVYIGPLARYYFGGSPKGYPFAQLNLQWESVEAKVRAERAQVPAVKPLPILKVIGMRALRLAMSIS